MTPTPARRRRGPFALGDLSVPAGRAATTELPISRLVTGTEVSLPVRVVHGRGDGPTIWLSAAVHGDEIAGVEIIRRVLDALDARSLAGTVLAVPIVNVHGFLHGDRYLPDRRDLNRSFPGSPNGSLASRIANVFMEEVVHRSEVGIDLHTGSDHRVNLPQIRADLDDPTTRELAVAFGAPVALHARLRDGSLRAAAVDQGATMLLFEGGEAWRFDRAAIDAGVAGVGNVLTALGMYECPSRRDGSGDRMAVDHPIECRSSSWLRTRRSGIADLLVGLGDQVSVRQRIAVVRDSVGRKLATVSARNAGIVIGHTQHPLVNQGDAVVHIAVPVEAVPVEAVPVEKESA